MADDATVNAPATESTDAAPPVVDQSVADVSDSQSQSAGVPKSDAFDSSIEADPWADMSKETPDDTAQTTDQQAEPEKSAEAVKTEEAPKEEKSIEEQVLEEAFGDNPPETPAKDEKPKGPKDFTDEELDTADPEAMIEAQKTAQGKAWAARNARRAEVVKEFAYSEKPITEIATNLRQLNETRYTELAQHAAHELVDANPEATFQRAFIVSVLKANPYADPSKVKVPTLESVINGTFAQQNGHQPAAQGDAADPLAAFAEQTKELDTMLSFDWRDPANDDQFYDQRELAMAKVLREAEKNVKAFAQATKPPEQKEEKPPEQQPQNGQQSKYTPEQQEEIRGDLDKGIKAYRSEIDAKILPYIAKNTGLEISTDDTPEIKAFKENLMLHYRGTDYQRANDIPSDFEAFATNESSVADQLNEVYTRIVDLKLKEVVAAREGRKADVEKFRKDAEDERVNVINLFGVANREFKARRIDPHLKVIGKLSTSLTQKTTEASRRVEVTSNGGEPPASRPPVKNFATAEDVWEDMAESAKEDDRLRAAA
jgi:hypothetical protein